MHSHFKKIQLLYIFDPLDYFKTHPIYIIENKNYTSFFKYHNGINISNNY